MDAQHRSRRQNHMRALLYVMALGMTAIAIFPFYWTIAGSFKSYAEIFQIPPTFFPKTATVANYLDVYRGTFFPCLQNSILIAAVSMAISLLLGIPAAYAFGRFRSRWSTAIFLGILAIRMFPSVSFMLPMYMMFRSLGLYNTRLALIVSHLTWQLPFVIWLLEGYIRDIPVELEESARMDGCSRWSSLIRVVLPLAAPGVSVAGIFAFIMSWNEFPFALALTSTTAAKTATVSIAETITSYQIFWGQMMASGAIFMLPVLFFSLSIQRFMVKALVAGAVKG